MTTASEPAPGAARIGTAERSTAMKALDAHLAAGRLDADEYGERAARASVARTQADLDPLFADLPGATPTVRQAPGPAAPLRPGEPLGGRAGEVAVAASPFVAVVLFFALQGGWHGSWVMFLLIPLAGAIVYGPDRAWGRHDRRRQRYRNRRW